MDGNFLGGNFPGGNFPRTLFYKCLLLFFTFIKHMFDVIILKMILTITAKNICSHCTV